MARTYQHGTEHVGIRRVDGSREWETYDRETGSRIGMPLPSRYEAQAYAEHRQATTYSVTAPAPTLHPVSDPSVVWHGGIGHRLLGTDDGCQCFRGVRMSAETCGDCGLVLADHLDADECEAAGIDPGLRDGLGCAVRLGGAIVRTNARCEGYNVAGRWVDCDRPMPHAHGIIADMLADGDA